MPPGRNKYNDEDCITKHKILQHAMVRREQKNTCGNRFRGDELGTPERGASLARAVGSVPPDSRLDWKLGTGTAISVTSGIP